MKKKTKQNNNKQEGRQPQPFNFRMLTLAKRSVTLPMEWIACQENECSIFKEPSKQISDTATSTMVPLSNKTKRTNRFSHQG